MVNEQMDNIKKQPLVILTGPTAVGKTDLSLKLAKKINGSIISADSMQVYKKMDIGTAKIRKEDMRGISHYLIDILEPEEEFDVVKFKIMAEQAIDDCLCKGKIPIVTGGTGFYIQALIYDIDFGGKESEEKNDDKEYRNYLTELAKEKGNEYIFNILKETDPVSAQRIHKNNVKRVIRALEFYRQTGKLMSEHNDEQKNRHEEKNSKYNLAYFVLNDDREKLYERIDRRVDEMFAEGFEQEMKNLIDMGIKKEYVSMQGIGYKEMFGYFEKNYDLEYAKDLIKKDTRHFAKRQLTWFRGEKNVEWYDYSEYGYSQEKILNSMLGSLAEKKIIIRGK